MKTPTLSLLLCLLTQLCPAQSHTHDHHKENSHHPKPSAHSPNAILSLDVYAHRGILHVLTARHDKTTDRNQLHYQSSHDDGKSWTDPVQINTGPNAPHARGRGTDFQLAATRDALTAIWLTKGSGYGGRGPLGAAHSTDGGKTWRPSANPADDATDGDHAFIDTVSTPQGHFHAAWLDTRSGEGKGLITAASHDQGRTWQANVAIDPETCECCWNTLKSDAAGTLYALYRDLNPRDMAVARSTDNGQTWNRLPTAGDFKWEFEGCPHVGGGLAIENAGPAAILHTLIWTGKAENAGLHYLRANAPDFTWTPAKRIGSRTAKYADIAIDASQRLLATWTETSAQGNRIVYSISDDSGDTWSFAPPIAFPAQSPTHPRVVTLGNTFHLFWTDHTGLQTKRIP